MKTYTVLKKLLEKFFIWLFRVETEGMENIPKEGGVLLCPNHLSNWDPIIIGAVSKRQIRFMAKSSLFKIPLLNSLIKALGAFPVHRGSADPSALKKAIGYLKDGDAVGLFPQGTRMMGKEPDMTGVKSGVGMISFRAKADVVPVYIKTKDYRIKLFRKVYLKFGKVIPYEELGFDKGNQEEYTAAAEKIFTKVLELKDQNL